MRDLHPLVQSEVLGDHVRPFVAVELDYPSGIVRACSLDRNITIEGKLYYGVSLLGEVGELVEGSENRSYGFTVSLSGIPKSFLDYLRVQDVQGREAVVRLGFVDAGYQLLGSTVIIAVGRMDAQDLAIGKKIENIVSIESIQVDWERARVRRYTDVDQQSEHPGDDFFKYMSAMENLTLRWGR
ncbi:hypothetical protein [Undibacterium sp.]|uniref:hypothetical protein n=1 Tax=Undibacterium sp. TaxID=1914977 RepID=UPI003750F2B3